MGLHFGHTNTNSERGNDHNTALSETYWLELYSMASDKLVRAWTCTVVKKLKALSSYISCCLYLSENMVLSISLFVVLLICLLVSLSLWFLVLPMWLFGNLIMSQVTCVFQSYLFLSSPRCWGWLWHVSSQIKLTRELTLECVYFLSWFNNLYVMHPKS